MKKFAFATIIAASTAVGVAGFAIADEQQSRRGAHMIEKFDANADGAISKAEIEAVKAARFAEADANGDGTLTMDEIETWREAERERRMENRKKRMFERQDVNGDGVISIEEFETRGMPMFDRIDANGDEVLSSDELEAMKSHRGERRGWHHRRGDADQD